MRKLTVMEVLDYEVKASWWAPLLSWDWAQELAAGYFGWKVRRKFRRYEWHYCRKQELKEA